MAEWRPIETAPLDALVDLWAGGERLPDCFWEADSGEWRQKYAETGPSCSFTINSQPSHWMPRPPGPQPGAAGAERTQLEKTLALLVSRLCHRLSPDDGLREAALDHLRRNGLLSPLRGDQP